MTLAGNLLRTYNSAPVTFVAGEGCELIDDRGNRYLDCIAGIGVCALGHAHPAIADAIASQARRLVHTSNLYHHEPAGELARELARRSGFAGVFFCNSGTEANEAAIKIARKRAYRRGERKRTTILACTGSFHGRTLGSLAATSNASYREGFGPLPGGFAFAPFNDVDALTEAIDESIAAFIVEPVQGESGVHPATPAYLAAARRRCDEAGALLIFDEVQCGMGRIGRLFAFQEFGVVPDAITIAKALGNGLPIGALLANERAAVGFEPGDHGSTFGGSPVPCAAALAHLQIRDATRLETHVRARSAQLLDGLEVLAAAYPTVLEKPRGRGLLAGLPVKEPYNAEILAMQARDRGLLLGTAGGNTLRFAPPLIISADEVAQATAALRSAIEACLATRCV